MPNATVTASTERSATGMHVGVAADEGDGGVEPAAANLLDGRRGAWRRRNRRRRPAPPAGWRARGDRQIGRAGAQIEHALAAGERQGADRQPPPSPIDARAEEMIEKVVAGPRSRRTCPRCGRGFWRRTGLALVVLRKKCGSFPVRTNALPGPRRIQIVFEAERAENLPRHEIGEIVQRLRLLIEGGHGREHDARLRRTTPCSSAAAGSSASRAAR